MIQYFLFSQWRAIKKYANKRGISIIGDMPIYVANDSADVWANKEIFKLNPELKASELAGCPPDCFHLTDSFGVIPYMIGKNLKSKSILGGLKDLIKVSRFMI